MGTHGDIRARFQMAMNEASGNPVWRNKSEAAYYAMFPKKDGGRWIMPGKSWEIMRAYFGSIDTVSEIQKFLELNGIKAEYYSDELDPSNKSGSFASWSITFNVDTMGFGKKFIKGDTWHIINARKESASGVVAIIGDKDSNPKKMKLTDIHFKTLNDIKTVARENVKIITHDDEYINFMQVLVDVVSGHKITHDTFDNAMEMANNDAKYRIHHDFSKYSDIIDPVSINNIMKDFGEVLGGILVFNILDNPGSGLFFPGSESEAVVDFTFDNLAVSSKAGDGANASASGYLDSVNNAINNKDTPWTVVDDEKDFIDNFSNVVLAESDEPKNNIYYTGARGSKTFSSTVKLCNSYLPRTSGWFTWAKASGMDTHSLNRDSIVQSFVSLRDQGKLYVTFRKYLNDVGGFKEKKGSSSSAKMTLRLVKAKNEDEIASIVNEILEINRSNMYDVLVGIILYTSSNDLVDVLNVKYEDVMSSMINKALSAKQLYLKMNLTKGYLEFHMKSMKTAKFKIKGLNGSHMWMMRGLSIKMIK